MLGECNKEEMAFVYANESMYLFEFVSTVYVLFIHRLLLHHGMTSCTICRSSYLCRNRLCMMAARILYLAYSGVRAFRPSANRRFIFNLSHLTKTFKILTYGLGRFKEMFSFLASDCFGENNGLIPRPLNESRSFLYLNCPRPLPAELRLPERSVFPTPMLKLLKFPMLASGESKQRSVDDSSTLDSSTLLFFVDPELPGQCKPRTLLRPPAATERGGGSLSIARSCILKGKMILSSLSPIVSFLFFPWTLQHKTNGSARSMLAR